MVEWIMEPNWLVPLMIRKNGNDARVCEEALEEAPDSWS